MEDSRTGSISHYLIYWRIEMNILYLKNSRGYHFDLLEILKKRNHSLIIEEIPDEEVLLQKILVKGKDTKLWEKLETDKWEIIFTLDYYPCISMLCNKMNKYYVSWNLEPPFSNLYSSTVINSGNLVFTADKWLAETFQRDGIKNVFYLPEGVNLERCNRISVRETEIDCSLIGDSKIPSWQELFQTEHLLDATLGYLEGILASQNLIYGRDFFAGGLPDYLYKDLMNNSAIRLPNDSVQSIQHYYAEQCFYPRTTAVDRTIAAKVLTKVSTVNLYTDDKEFQYSNLINGGKVPYEKRLEIIAKSKINVSISPRGLRSGIYGHNLQIMGMKGFLITDYKDTLEDEFVSGEDLIIYEDMKHLADSVEYYLKHPEEREKTGIRAYNKVVEKHSLEHRINIIEKKIEELISI